MSDIDDLLRDLRDFEQRRVVLAQLRKRIRQPLPAVRRAVRARAIETLPRRGGLGRWVARARVSADLRTTGRSAGLTLRGSRKSLRDASDLRRIDAGRVRAPAWGRRGPGQWHTQAVRPGWFTEPAGEVDQWLDAVDDAVLDAALVIARG